MAVDTRRDLEDRAAFSGKPEMGDGAHVVDAASVCRARVALVSRGGTEFSDARGAVRCAGAESLDGVFERR
jgi:hypothetical protein